MTDDTVTGLVIISRHRVVPAEVHGALIIKIECGRVTGNVNRMEGGERGVEYPNFHSEVHMEKRLVVRWSLNAFMAGSRMRSLV